MWWLGKVDEGTVEEVDGKPRWEHEKVMGGRMKGK